MSGHPSVQTLFRCGVCFEMFATSEDCYSHLVTHEGAAHQEPAGEQEGEIEAELHSDTQGLLQQAAAAIKTEAIDLEEEGQAGEVLENADQSESNVQDVLEVVGASVPGTQTVWVDNDGVVKSQQNEPRSTNEDLDIADILINIKQEKSDGQEYGGSRINLETSDLLQLATQVSNVAPASIPETVSVGVGTEKAYLKPAKKKPQARRKPVKKVPVKDAEAQVDKSEAPIVRRKRRGDEDQDKEEEVEAYACKVCGKRYAILKSLKYHERTHDVKNLHYCDLCEKGFVKPSELSNHKKSHTAMKDRRHKGANMFKCKYCDKEYSIEKSLRHHEKVHEVGNRYNCKRCNKNFFKPSDLQRHSKVHQPLSKCYICNKPFRDPKKLESHVRQHPEVLLQEEKLKVKTSDLMYCKYCNKKCATFSQLCNHVRIHTKKKPFPCDICGKLFNRVSNMRLHRKLHSGKKPFRCDVCGIAYADVTNKNRHMRKYHQQGNLCANAAFYKPRSSKVLVVDELPPAPKLKLERETLVHELRSAYEALDNDDLQTEVPYKTVQTIPKSLLQCREVQGIPQQVQQLISAGTDVSQVITTKSTEENQVAGPDAPGEQVYVVFEDNPSVCYVLEYEGDKNKGSVVPDMPVKTMVEQTTMTDEVEILDETGEEAHGINISLAELQDADEVDDEALQGNLDSELNDLMKNISQRTLHGRSSNRYKCSVCGLKFKHQGSLKFHYRKHTKEGVMYCEVCGAEFYRKSRLRVHLLDHTGERPYKCSTCEMTFKVHYDLTVHQRQHTGHGALKCGHCTKIFYTRRSLNAHLRSQSNVKPFSCTRCGKLFKRQDQRRRHMLTHSGNLPFKCHKCERAFGDTSNRKRHIIKFHGMDALKSLPKGRISLVKNVHGHEKHVLEATDDSEDIDEPEAIGTENIQSENNVSENVQPESTQYENSDPQSNSQSENNESGHIQLVNVQLSNIQPNHDQNDSIQPENIQPDTQLSTVQS